MATRHNWVVPFQRLGSQLPARAKKIEEAVTRKSDVEASPPRSNCALWRQVSSSRM
jgi:hypothetical protein